MRKRQIVKKITIRFEKEWPQTVDCFRRELLSKANIHKKEKKETTNLPPHLESQKQKNKKQKTKNKKPFPPKLDLK